MAFLLIPASNNMVNVKLIPLIVCSLIVLAGGAAAQESAAAEQELFRMINQDRAQARVPDLQWNEWLAQAAHQHAEEMAKRRELLHQFPGEPSVRDRIDATELRFNASAENVAFGPSVSDLNNGWMQSPAHRENMLNPKYNAVGIAVVRNPDGLYAVADFAHTVPGESASEVEDEVGTAINQVRSRANLSALSRRQDTGLRSYACDMAKNNRVSASGLLGRPNVLASAAFTDSDPANFDKHVRDAGKVAGYHAYAVGACFGRNPDYPEGTNYVAVVYY